MKLGEQIKERRKNVGLSVEELAKRLQERGFKTSVSTLYRYESSDIAKIPVDVFDAICQILQTTPAELMYQKPADKEKKNELPIDSFKSAEEAMRFLINLPTLAAYGGYDPTKMDEKTLIDFSNEILNQIKLVSYKYR